MADFLTQKNIGALIDARSLSGAVTSVTAGGAGNGVLINSLSFDRLAFATGAMPRCMDLEIYYFANIAATKTLTFLVQPQSAPDNATWTNFGPAVTTIVATGVLVNFAGLYRHTIVTADNPAIPAINFYPAWPAVPNVDLNSAQRYIRVQLTPTLSAASVDTVVISQIAAILAGWDYLASPAA